MDPKLIAIFALVILGCIGSLVLLVRAFQVSPWWGVASLIIPFAQTVFGLCHWSRAKYSFLITHLSFLAVIGILIQGGIPLTQESVITALGGSISPLALHDVPELTSMIQDKRGEIEKLEAHFQTLGLDLTRQFAELNKKRVALKADDTAAVQQFNAEAAAYDTKNLAHKDVAKDLESARKELQELLDERSRRAPQREPKP